MLNRTISKNITNYISDTKHRNKLKKYAVGSLLVCSASLLLVGCSSPPHSDENQSQAISKTSENAVSINKTDNGKNQKKDVYAKEKNEYSSYQKLANHFYTKNYNNLSYLVTSYNTNQKTLHNMDKSTIKMFDKELSSKNKKTIKKRASKIVSSIKTDSNYKKSGEKGKALHHAALDVTNLFMDNLNYIKKSKKTHRYYIANEKKYNNNKEKIDKLLSTILTLVSKDVAEYNVSKLKDTGKFTPEEVKDVYEFRMYIPYDYTLEYPNSTKTYKKEMKKEIDSYLKTQDKSIRTETIREYIEKWSKYYSNKLEKEQLEKAYEEVEVGVNELFEPNTEEESTSIEVDSKSDKSTKKLDHSFYIPETK